MDLAELDEIFADDLVHIHSTGLTQDKPALLAHIDGKRAFIAVDRGRLEIRVEGECDPHRGWLMDYAEIKQAFQPIFDQLDHHCLNEIPGLEIPTSENLAKWIWARLKPPLPLLTAIVVAETRASKAEYRG